MGKWFSNYSQEAIYYSHGFNKFTWFSKYGVRDTIYLNLEEFLIPINTTYMLDFLTTKYLRDIKTSKVKTLNHGTNRFDRKAKVS